MKKMLMIAIVIVATTSLAGCGFNTCCNNYGYTGTYMSTTGCCGSSSW